MSLRNFFRLLRHGPPPDGHGVDDSLTKALKDSSSVCGVDLSSTSSFYKQIEKSHKNYAESFKKNKK